MADTEIKDAVGGPAQSTEAKHAHHPRVGEYIEIGIILAVLTAIEVALFYAPVPREVAVPSLIGLTIAKFVLVVMWFMHLRFDSKVFRRMLIAGVLLAAILYAVAVVLVT